ncbi:MAG: phosphoenolpyruvate--protein phosphotransferase [Acidobacteria bacterium]|nr:phosphoenolpyruvate--protein phosphotransferase [Acidobacteriota bacterium]
MSSKRCEGIGVSPGVVSGRAVVVERGVGDVPERLLEPNDIEAEVTRFDQAIDAVRSELGSVERRAGREVGEELARIFDAQKLILDDRSFVETIRSRIRDDRRNAEAAVRDVANGLQARFARIDDSYLRDRGADIETLATHLLRILLGQEALRLDHLEESVVVVAHDLSPAETATLDREHVLGFVTDAGGRTSHTAIMARSMEIPAVVGTHDATLHVQTGDRVILDGAEGVMIVNPSAEIEAEYEQKRSAYEDRESVLAAMREELAETPDGLRITLQANLESVRELEGAHRHGATGIGLYRSEFLYLRADGELPDEEAHFEEYRAILQEMGPAQVTIRTMDLGGEKSLPTALRAAGDNSLLGLRGIRRSLHDADIFAVQLRGLIRASAYGNLRIVLPFVTELAEVLEARKCIDAVAADLRQSGVAFDEDIPIGAMLEVPAASLIVEQLSDHVDFFSVGTNDLIQYLLAVDRTNDAVADLYEPLHPGVLRVLNAIATTAREREIPLCLCGEVAADPLTAMVMIGLGYEDLSMAPGSIPVIKNLVRHLPGGDARRIAREALALRTAAEVEEFALAELMAHLPDDFSVAG